MNKKLLLVAAAVVAAVGAFAEAERPNILWIVAEDMNDWFSCYGDTVIETPALDSIAEGGLRFTRAYVPAPICSTARSSFITGRMCSSIGAHHHRSSRNWSKDPELADTGMVRLPEGTRTLPELFRAAGYATFMDDKRDYNFVYDDDELFSVKNLEAAVASGKPFWGQVRLHGGKNERRIFKGERKVSPDEVTLPPYYPDVPEFREAYAEMYENVLASDIRTRDILDQLERLGVADDTVVIFFTDHGVHHGLRHKQFCYEGGIRVPLMIRWPENFPVTEAGLVRDDLVSLIDISASSLALAGIGIPGYVEGRDLFAEDYRPREYVVATRDRADYTVDHIRALITERYKYIRNLMPDRPWMQPQYRDGEAFTKAWRRLKAEGKLPPEGQLFAADTKPKEELYDLVADPHEIHNLAGDPEYRTELERHRALLDEWMRESGDHGRQPESPESLLQILYRWGDMCTAPEFDAVREQYGEVEHRW